MDSCYPSIVVSADVFKIDLLLQFFILPMPVIAIVLLCLVLLLQFVFVCASVVSYEAFLWSLFVPQLSSFPPFGALGGLCFVIEAFPQLAFFINL